MSNNLGVVFLGVIVSMCFVVSGCSIKEKLVPAISGADQMDFVQVEGFSIDNATSLDDLLTNEYSLNDLYSYFGKDSFKGSGLLNDMPDIKYHTWEDVNLIFPVQCIRYYQNVHYTVYRVTEGGYFYIFWSVPLAEAYSSLTNIGTSYSIYIDDLVSKSKFKSLRKSFSTARDVLEIDPNMELDFISSSVSSYSLLDNGQIVLVEYSCLKIESIDDLIVKNITIWPRNAVCSKIAAISLEDLDVAQEKVP